MEKIYEVNLNEIEIYHDKNIVKYKGYEFQIIEGKYLRIKQRNFRIPEPYIPKGKGKNIELIFNGE